MGLWETTASYSMYCVCRHWLIRGVSNLWCSLIINEGIICLFVLLFLLHCSSVCCWTLPWSDHLALTDRSNTVRCPVNTWGIQNTCRSVCPGNKDSYKAFMGLWRLGSGTCAYWDFKVSQRSHDLRAGWSCHSCNTSCRAMCCHINQLNCPNKTHPSDRTLMPVIVLFCTLNTLKVYFVCFMLGKCSKLSLLTLSSNHPHPTIPDEFQYLMSQCFFSWRNVSER